jgi:hypothetical protein
VSTAKVYGDGLSVSAVVLQTHSFSVVELQSVKDIDCGM